MPTKKRAEIGFDLSELTQQMSSQAAGTSAPAASASVATDLALGRPRTLPQGTASLSVRITPEQRRWLLREVAQRMLATGERQDASQLIRELIDQARARA